MGLHQRIQHVVSDTEARKFPAIASDRRPRDFTLVSRVHRSDHSWRLCVPLHLLKHEDKGMMAKILFQ
jgi:hypothetical protein